MILEAVDVAKVCHAANRQYKALLGEPTPAWEELSDELRRVVIDGVIGYRNGTLHSPEQSHESWMADMLANGWTLGPVRDEMKTHPCLVPYHELPIEQQRKDALFVGIIKALSFGEGARWNQF